jgi:predicted metalloprotease
MRKLKPFRGGTRKQEGIVHAQIIAMTAASLLLVTSLQTAVDAQSGLTYEQYRTYEAQGAARANTFWREGFEQAKREQPGFQHEYHDLMSHFVGRGEYIDSRCGGLAGDPEDSPDLNPAFHCPVKNAAYFSSSWLYREYYTKIGHYAPWVIIAHEVGHHVQRQVDGIDDNGQPRGRIRQKDMELHADCLAGILSHYLEKEGYIEPGASEQGAQAVYTLGDKTNNEGDPHGTSDERKEEFSAGYNSGDMDKCTERLARATYECDPEVERKRCGSAPPPDDRR